ncbi:non-ribosomal peptide synthetase [Nonomuraea sp. NPDC049400]|uniref:non-ribosomal peptide synthetase n=1 Tax=Nonomuraea sp. NPDC049400 TaxID=3364352 RepID=UPI0037B922BD
MNRVDNSKGVYRHMTELSVARGGEMPPAPAAGTSLLDWYSHWCTSGGGPALEQAGRVWSYSELDALAEETADGLRPHIGRGSVVAVCLDRGLPLVVTAVALAKLQAVYLPLGPRPPQGRLTSVQRSVRISAVIEGDRSALASPLPAGAFAVFADRPGGRTQVHEGSFYSVLTSGSTGSPKLVAVSEDSLTNVVRWYVDLVELAPGQRHSLALHPPFDPHLMETWSTLCSGATLVVAPEAVRSDPGALVDWWADARITVSNLPTPLAELSLARPWRRALPLRHLVIGGDRLRRGPSAGLSTQVHNLYGPAEAAVVSTAQTLSDLVSDQGDPSIGAPIPGVAVCVVNQDGEIVPRGEKGELLIGGVGLALACYDDQGELPVFSAPPALLDDQANVYASGDLVRMRHDGTLDFCGRLDDQLKVRGVRIEPAEVERALERFPGVRRAAVVRTSGEVEELTAFLEMGPGTLPDLASLRNHAREWLPAAAVPTAFEAVESLPLTASGKIDRSGLTALHQPVTPMPLPPEEANPAEAMILELCSDLLGCRVSLAERFTDIGGNSLMTARLLNAVLRRTGVRLRATDILRQEDLRGIAALIDLNGMRGAGEG